VLGRALARAESVFEDDQVVPELNEKFNLSTIPPRAEAYRNLALAIANIMGDEWKAGIKALQDAQAPNKAPGEPRFWARVAWAHYLLGDMARVAQARSKVLWFSKKAESDQTVQLVDAALLIGSGLPDQALSLATKLAGRRPRMLKVYANIDLGKYADAHTEAEALLKEQPSREAETLVAWSRMLKAGNDKDREEAANALDSAARKAKSKLPAYALGMSWLLVGKHDKAKPELEAAITGVSDEAPNPVAYRTLTALAEVALIDKDLARAGKYLDWSLDSEAIRRPELVLSNGTTKINAIDPTSKQRTPYADYLKANSGYFPTRAMQARVVLRANDPDRALKLLEPILKEAGDDPTKAGAVTPAVKLTLAEALITRKGSSTKDKEQAKKILEDLQAAKLAPEPELSRIAALIDPKLPKEMGLPDPEDPAEKAPKKPPRRGR